MDWDLRFLGVGSGSSAPKLGSSSAVILKDKQPWLLIDCGQEAFTAFQDEYGTLPRAIFITHLHLDHIAGLEQVFFKAYFNPELRGKIKLYVPAALIPHFQSRMADYPGVVAEGGANWWDAFHLIPVSTNGFWHDLHHLEVFAVRHHLPNSAFGLRLPGSFVWSGDTRPIPEQMERYVSNEEFIAHDSCLTGNPSHTGLDDLLREYSPALQKRLCLYHYDSLEDAALMRAKGFRVAERMETVSLNPPSTGIII